MLFSEPLNVLAALHFKSRWLNWYHLQTHQETLFETELIRPTQASSVPIDALFLRRGSMNRLAYNFWNFNKNDTNGTKQSAIVKPVSL